MGGILQSLMNFGQQRQEQPQINMPQLFQGSYGMPAYAGLSTLPSSNNLIAAGGQPAYGSDWSFTDSGGGGGNPGFMGGILGRTDPDGTKHAGWGGLALGAASGIGNAYLGMKQYGLAKDSLKENKRQFNQNFGAQQKMTNSRLEDRQNARNAASGGQQDTASYMKKWGV